MCRSGDLLMYLMNKYLHLTGGWGSVGLPGEAVDRVLFKFCREGCKLFPRSPSFIL